MSKSEKRAQTFLYIGVLLALCLLYTSFVRPISKASPSPSYIPIQNNITYANSEKWVTLE